VFPARMLVGKMTCALAVGWCEPKFAWNRRAFCAYHIRLADPIRWSVRRSVHSPDRSCRMQGENGEDAWVAIDLRKSFIKKSNKLPPIYLNFIKCYAFLDQSFGGKGSPWFLIHMRLSFPSPWDE
jgi:hypothetical protein